MARVEPPRGRAEPQSAADYDERTVRAVRAVLIEVAQILGSFRDEFVIVGGAVPWLLLDNDAMRHVGTVDIDLGLDAEALGDGEYARLVELLKAHGYARDEHRREFQLVRRVPALDGGPPIDIVVDFLIPARAAVTKNRPPLIDGFRPVRASGAGLALQFRDTIEIEGEMPGGMANRVKVAIASIPALLAMKGFALDGRYKQKDAYDVYYCVRNFPGGPGALAEACRPLLVHEDAAAGYENINARFESFDGFGPKSVRRFVEETDVLQERTADQWQQDAFGQVDVWLRLLGLRTGSRFVPRRTESPRLLESTGRRLKEPGR